MVLSVELSASAPVNPVQEEGILSLMCQVTDLNPDIHGVRISRHVSGRQEWITYNNVIFVEDERIFLAVRHIGDGSVIYFMTITGVTREDEGEYTCKILQDLNAVASKSVDITVDYYPEDTFPICQFNSPIEVEEGKELTFNCTSEEASPPVSLEWTRTGSSKTYAATESRINGLVTSTLTIVPKWEDHNGMFLCKIAFDGYHPDPKSCHIGPIQVIRKSEIHEPGTDTKNRVTLTAMPVLTTNTMLRFATLSTVESIDCRKTCSYFNSSVLQWVIGTVVAAFLAILFFIIGVVILYKWNQIVDNDFRHQHNNMRHMHATKEDIYMELEKRRECDRVYMALDKENKRFNTYNQALVLQHRNEFDNNGNQK